MDFSDVIKLDVGGKKFETTRSTIIKYDTMLRRMFSDNFEVRSLKILYIHMFSQK